MEIHNTVRAAPVGSCIYCGATDHLTDEHIIPLALDGRFVLPDSSCPKCAAIMSAFEGRVLRGFMLAARTAGGYPTRRRKERPKSLPLQIERNGVFEQIELESTKHPGFLQLPRLESAGLLTGRQSSPGVLVCGLEQIYFGKNPADVAKDIGVKTIRITDNLDINSFARLLAKIGYSYAVAVLGLLPREHIPVLPVILGTADDASFWLGSAQFQLPIEAKGPLHSLGYDWITDPSDASRQLLLVRVKLFVPSGATGYEIIVCRL